MRSTVSLSIGREALLSLGSKGVNGIVGFIGVVVFANVLGDVGLGEYRTVIAAALVLTQVPAGTANAVRKRVSEVDIDPPAYLGAGLVTHAAFTAVALVVYALVAPFATAYFGTVQLGIGVVVAMAALGLFNVTNRFYAGVGYPALSSWVDAARSVLTLGFQLLFLWLGFEAFGLVVGYAVGTVISAGISFGAARVVPLLPTREAFESIFAFARWSIPNSLLLSLYNNTDVLILRAVAGAGPVGFYTVAAQLSQPASMFSHSISGALAVKSSGVDSTGGDVRQDLLNSMSYVGLVAIPMVFGALAIPNALMTTLFGASFADAPGLALVGLTLFQLANSYRNPFDAVIEGTDRPSLLLRTNVGVIALHLPAAFVLGSLYGLLGVIASTVMVSTLRLIVYQWYAHRYFGGVVFTRPIVKQVVAGAIMFGAVEALSTLVIIDSWVLLTVVVGSGAIVYFAVLLVVSSHFRETLRHVVFTDGR